MIARYGKDECLCDACIYNVRAMSFQLLPPAPFMAPFIRVSACTSRRWSIFVACSRAASTDEKPPSCFRNCIISLHEPSFLLVYGLTIVEKEFSIRVVKLSTMMLSSSSVISSLIVGPR